MVGSLILYIERCNKMGKNKVIKESMAYQIAYQRHPFMGLDNKICKNPVYWCRLHQVWLSEDDVKKKQCKCKRTFDMVGTYRCGNLEKNCKVMK